MPKTYKISAENAAEIEEVRKTNTDKKVDRRLYCSLSRKTQKIDTQNAKIPFETP